MREILPRINFEVRRGLRKKIKEKCVREGKSIKEVGIRLFARWLKGKTIL